MTRSITVLAVALMLAGCAATPLDADRHALAVAAEDQQPPSTELGGQNAFNGTNTFSGGASFTGGLSIGGPVTFTGPITLPAGTPASSAPTRPIFLKLDGIDGESTANGHENEINVNSFSFDVTSASTAAATGSGAGKAKFSPIVIIKNTDKSSPKLMESCASGRHLRSAILKVYKAGDANAETEEWTLTDVAITELGRDPASTTGAERVGMSFSKISWKTISLRPDGGVGTITTGGFDLRLNRAGLLALPVLYVADR